jgi:hypothetical protein
MWLRVLVVVFTLSSLANAQQFSLGGQMGLTFNFGLPSSFSLLVSTEARRLAGGFGVRGTLGVSHALEVAVDGVYRFDDSPQGLLYIGGGLGLSSIPRATNGVGRFEWDGELRGVIGYEWEIGSNLRVCLEGVVRAPFSSDPRLAVLIGLVWLPR